MSGAVQLSWQSFEANYLGGPPREVVLPGTAGARLFVADDAKTFGMRVRIDPGTIVPDSPASAIRLMEARSGGSVAAEVRCVPAAASKEFFYFLLAIADGMQLKGLSFPEAFEEAVKAWRELLKGLVRMSEENELGLFGELLTLGLLVKKMGPGAVDHWTGPTDDPHDFRVRRNELEVKTTAGSSRIHVINGLTQLTPSLKCRLHLVSWQLERAGPGSGESLPERIADVRRALRAKPGASARFEQLLSDGTSWLDSDAQLFPVRWRERSEPRLIAVDADCPRITAEVLAPGLTTSVTALISDVHYRVNLEGRGIPLNSRQFERILLKGGSL